MSELPRPGETLGRYRILGLLGRGGMGVVLRALQTDLNREVALKLLPTDLADNEEFAARFRREANTLASLDSPHIIAVYDHGELDGRLFIATQLVRGGDLGQLLATSGPPALSEGLEIVAQVASALAAAHEAGVIHRDVKPSNVLLRREEAGWHAYLCDFGIAQTGGSEFTNAGTVVGTFSYLAPERCEGAPASIASDIYALGCLLVAVVAGSAPYAGSDFQVARQHVSSPVPQWAPVFAGAAQLNQILARSMAKSPDDRYDSARALRSDLLVVARQVTSADRYESKPVVPAETTQLRAPKSDAPSPAAPADLSTTSPRGARTWRLAAVTAVAAAIMASGLAAFVALRPSDHLSGATISRSPSTAISPSPSRVPTPAPSGASQRRRLRQTAASAPETSSIRGGAYGQVDLPCDSRYVVVLASDLTLRSPFDAVEGALRRFDNPTFTPRYADAARSCSNLSHVEGASSAAWIPYLGPFDDAISACQARIEVADTTTYIAQLGASNTSKVLCACSFQDSDLPALSAAADAQPSREDSFWVVALQSMLTRAGFATQRIAGGHYGELTTSWVKSLQRSAGLLPTGAMDADTWSALKADAC